jgi:hypothetical protein
MIIKSCGLREHENCIGYWGQYDLYGCVKCDIWTEKPCNQNANWFKPAPEKPSLADSGPESFAKPRVLDINKIAKTTTDITQERILLKERVFLLELALESCREYIYHRIPNSTKEVWKDLENLDAHDKKYRDQEPFVEMELFINKLVIARNKSCKPGKISLKSCAYGSFGCEINHSDTICSMCSYPKSFECDCNSNK